MAKLRNNLNQNAFFHQGRAKTSLNQRIIDIKKKRITEMEQLFLCLIDETEVKSIYTMKNYQILVKNSWLVVAWRG